MSHRIIILLALTLLLCGCSGGEGTQEEKATGAAATLEEAEAVSPETGKDALTDGTEEPVDASGDDAGDKVEVETEAPVEAAIAEAPDETHIEESAAEEPEPVEEEIPAEPPGDSHLRVIRAYVCKGIEQSEPTEAGKSFVPEDGVLRLCCFSEIAGASGPDTVHHVWRWGDREMARVELEVKSSRWRTWSTKRILDEWRGEWHVDITDADGVLLSSLEFSVE